MKVYAETYQEARDKFTERVQRDGGSLFHYRHPSAKGAVGEDLFMDVAVFGDPQAARKLVFIGGVHGLEGLVASAVMSAWLDDGLHRSLPEDCGAVLIHGVNPWGISHYRRTNENNVDLNRNFIEFPVERENERYAEIHPLVCFERWSEEAVENSLQGLEEFAARHGMPVLIDTMFGGQYSHPNGVEFGGQEPQWSTTTFRQVIDEHVLPTRKVFYVDWHTGLGEYGKKFFVHSYDDESSEARRLAEVFGPQILAQGTGFLGGQRPAYRGILGQEFETRLAKNGAAALGMVVEFGTKDNHGLKRNLILDRWLHEHGGQLPPAEKSRLSQDLLAGFYPKDPEWRQAVIEEARSLFENIRTALTRSI